MKSLETQEARFEVLHDQWLQDHLNRRKGERRRRLIDGYDHAERLFVLKVWWLAVGSLQYLHPEFEVSDYREGKRYLDFAYLIGRIKLAIEIHGFHAHNHHPDRKEFSDERIRHNHLTIDGWDILYFAYSDIRDRPKLCQQILQQYIGRRSDRASLLKSDEDQFSAGMGVEERFVLRHILLSGSPVTIAEIAELLGCERQKARRVLHRLVQLGWLSNAGTGSARMTAFIVRPDRAAKI